MEQKVLVIDGVDFSILDSNDITIELWTDELLKQAEDEIPQCPEHKAVSLNELVELLVAHYDKLPDEIKEAIKGIMK